MRAIDLVTLIHPSIIGSGAGPLGAARAVADAHVHAVDWADEAECARFASRLAASPEIRDALLLLRGPLGAGKTTFARHLLHALGVRGRVKSPTYAVLEPYEADGFPISHFDFYRFADPREWEDAGFREIFGAPGLKIVEWPERAARHLPPAELAFHIEPVDELSRRVGIEAGTARGREWRARLAATASEGRHE